MTQEPRRQPQSPNPSAPAMTDMMPRPTREHELLKLYAGTWDARTKSRFMPDQPFAESTGSEVATLGFGGFWLTGEYRGTMHNCPFLGRSTVGFDPSRKKFVGTWIDSMSAGMGTSEGSFDDKKKTFTYHMTMNDPAGNPMRMRITDEFPSADTKVFSMFMTGPDGKEFLGMQITYTRRKA